MQTYKITLQSKKFLTKDVIEMRFDKPNDFTFTAGQFVQFEIDSDNKKIFRSYSISSAPNKAYLEFCVKLLPEGIGSRYFSNLQIGDTSSVRGPNGRFVLDTASASYTCIATGVGLAPIMSMLEDADKSKKIQLLFGVRREEDIFWSERLSQFACILTLSQPTDTWSGKIGRITSHLNTLDTQSDFYLCGSPDMVKETRTLLLQKGVPPQKIKFEIF